jgi:hypothetical protein
MIKQSFKSFLSESFLQETALVGNINDLKAVRHVKNYIAPYLSKSQIAGSEKSLAGHVKPGAFGTENGSEHNPDATHTHTLEKEHGGHDVGTQVKVTGVLAPDEKGRIHVSTEKHGNIPVSKLKKPENLAKPAHSAGFKTEDVIAKNLGGKSQGASKGTDIELNLRGGHTDHDVKAKVVETQEKPDVRIESKLDRGKVGEATLKHTPEKGWHVSERSPNKALGQSHLQHATYEDENHPGHGMDVISFLNKYHPTGHIDQYRYFKPKAGTSKAYLNQTGANYLHIHDKDSDTGTTFSVGNNHPLKGKTNVGHLSDATLSQMDHRLEVRPTTTGTSSMVHRPKRSFMKGLAAKAKTNPEQHADLSNQEHAQTFLSKAKSTLGIKE